jgi:saccharopine dehydrogenase (NAD+, L-lysine-forming)
MIIYLRAESYLNEYRVPLVPDDIKTLISHGHTIYVESSSRYRIFPDSDYEIVGAQITERAWWEQSSDTLIIGLKALDNLDKLNKHRHVYFSHSYRGQTGAKTILSAFAQSGSSLYDLEYFHTPAGKRVLAFGLYAGQVGTILGLSQHYNRSHGKPDIHHLKPWLSRKEMLESSKSADPSILIIGGGRCAQGVKDILDEKRISYTQIGKDVFPDMTAYDIVFNCILLDPQYNEVWIKPTDIITRPLLIVDISCDYSKPNNPIAIYKSGTTFEAPVFNYNKYISIIAIDNLPSLLPRDSSSEFSNRLTDLILRYNDSCWKVSLAKYYTQLTYYNLSQRS